jgi:hypothetical protein
MVANFLKGVLISLAGACVFLGYAGLDTGICWAGKSNPEVVIWKKVKSHLAAGQLLNACQQADKLKQYPKTPSYKEAESFLQAKGISIEDPLGSYTMKQIVALQNRTESLRAVSGKLPPTGQRKKYRDAWGRALRIEYVARPGFMYVIRSAGRDGKFFTQDDYVLGIRKDRAAGPKKATNIKDKARIPGNRGRLGGSGKPQRPGQSGGGMIPSGDGESTVTLDELINNQPFY